MRCDAGLRNGWFFWEERYNFIFPAHSITNVRLIFLGLQPRSTRSANVFMTTDRQPCYHSTEIETVNTRKTDETLLRRLRLTRKTGSLIIYLRWKKITCRQHHQRMQAGALHATVQKTGYTTYAAEWSTCFSKPSSGRSDIWRPQVLRILHEQSVLCFHWILPN